MKPIEMCDVECYVNYFLIKFYNPAPRVFTSYEIRGKFTAFSTEQIAAIKNHLVAVTSVTFNGLKYDWPMISCALSGMCCQDLKAVTNAIIGRNLQPWQVENEYGIKIMHAALVDHIDLIEVAPGQGSLKIYGGRLHCKFMQDLPIEHTATLTDDEMDIIERYCGNDLTTTANLWAKVKDDIDTRVDLSAQYGVDMRSKSDAQIAEAAFKALLGWSHNDVRAAKDVAYVRPGTQFFYVAPSFVRFSTPLMQNTLAMIERQPFTVGSNGNPEMSAELKACRVAIGDMAYQFGAGGLHSTEKRRRHVADAEYSLQDVDAASFYPFIISILGMYPAGMGEMFLTIYNEWIAQRLGYKNAGDKKKAALFKIMINGTFGKLGSVYSIMYAPQLLIQTTVTGQLCLMMLIEMMTSVKGISIVQANTDGIVIKCPRRLHMVRDAIVKRWERQCGFTTEANDYLALFSRDVNCYIAVKPEYTDSKGEFHPIEFKTKNEFADPGLQKNPANIVCVDAVKAYLVGGTPIEQTIRRCNDIRKFVTVRTANDKAGAYWVKDTLSATTIKGKTAELLARGWVRMVTSKNQPELWYDESSDLVLSLASAHETARQAVGRQYLGKALRWYYGRGQRGHIAMGTSGNMVARSEGAKPCMQLPDVFPADLDYDWYINEAREILKDIACA